MKSMPGERLSSYLEHFPTHLTLADFLLLRASEMDRPTGRPPHTPTGMALASLWLSSISLLHQKACTPALCLFGFLEKEGRKEK